MLQYRTDLAMEAHELLCAKSRAQTLSGVDSRTVFRRGCSVTSVRIDTEGAARQLGKPRGRYVTLDLTSLQKNADDMLERASRAVGAELRALLGENVKSVLVAGLGNANMTPDAIGPRSAEHVLVTRHLRQNGAFSAFCSVSVLNFSRAIVSLLLSIFDILEESILSNIDIVKREIFFFKERLPLVRTGARDLRHWCRGEGSAVGAARDKGDILSCERISPLNPQENARGLAP